MKQTSASTPADLSNHTFILILNVLRPVTGFSDRSHFYASRDVLRWQSEHTASRGNGISPFLKTSHRAWYVVSSRSLLWAHSPYTASHYTISPTAISFTLVPVGPVMIRPSTAFRAWYASFWARTPATVIPCSARTPTVSPSV